MDFNYKLNKYKFKINLTPKNKIYKSKFKYYNNLVGGFKSIDIKYILALKEFIKNHNIQNPLPSKSFIDSSHGIEHMLTVLCHTEKSLESWNLKHPSNQIDEKEQLKVKLASLLHDIDDSKYFGESTGYPNAKKILEETGRSDLTQDDIYDIIRIISWVSSSVNGDTIPNLVQESGKEYLLYPRYSDRLEAIGLIGLARTLEYTLRKNGILFDKETPRAKNKEDLFDRIATQKRYESYSGSSRSMMDHFYDKLLRLGKFPITNKYFESESIQRQNPLIDIALEFGRNSKITQDELKVLIEKYIKKSSQIVTQCLCDKEINDYIKNYDIV